jgi:hypothetical protein
MKALIALAALAVAVPAVAADSNQAAPAAQTGDEGATAPKKERKICKREATSIGLHSSRRVCMTAAEWRGRNRRAEDGDMGHVTARH